MSEGIIFHSPTFGEVSLEQAIQEIVLFVKQKPERFYKIIVGADSAATSPTEIVTAITIQRVGNGAIYFWMRDEQKKFATLRDRIYQEAINAITLAQELRGRLGKQLGDDFFWEGNEVHVDVGQGGKSRDLIESVTGMIRGYNFIPVIKPASFGASAVADRHT